MTTKPPSLDERIDDLLKNYYPVTSLVVTPKNSNDEKARLLTKIIHHKKEQAKQEIKAIVVDETQELKTKLKAQEMFLHESITRARIDEINKLLESSRHALDVHYEGDYHELRKAVLDPLFDRLATLTSEKPTLHDVVTGTPKGQSASQHAMEESIKVQNKIKPGRKP